MNDDNRGIFDYFERFAEINTGLVRQFLKRFPFHKSYIKKDVLDFGSGTGCLCFEVAEKCGSITGIDTDRLLYEYSKKKLRTFPESYQNKITFLNRELESLEDSSYDVIFSKDVFEHTKNTETLLEEMYRILKPGGECLIGFGPLWYSPYGDHGIVKRAFGFSFPWLHLILGEKNIVRAFNNSSLHSKEFSKSKITNLKSYLNLKPGEYFREIIQKSSFEVIWYGENINENWFLNFFKSFMVNSIFSRFFIRNIYCILKKPNS